jgi:hypothetical protein
MSDDPWTLGKHNTPSGRVGGGASTGHHQHDAVEPLKGLQRPVGIKREGKGPGARRGASARPNTSKRSPRAIRIHKRQQQVLDLRLQGYAYEAIAKHVGISKSQAERDVIAAMDAIIREPAERVFAMEMRRLDEMLAGHYNAACTGDATATSACLRIMQHRAYLLGWGTKDHVAKLTITDGAGAGGGEPKSLSIEFVLPGGGHVAMDALGSPGIGTSGPSIGGTSSPSYSPSPPSPRRIQPSPDDLVLERADRLPSAFKKPRGSFDWS